MLVSGTGSLLQALIAACNNPSYGVQICAVISDRPDILGLVHAQKAGIPTAVIAPQDFPDRDAWDAALAAKVRSYGLDFAVSAGFMRILGAQTLATTTFINTHPALLPAFPGAHGVRDALAYGVKITGTTCHIVDEGMDTGPIITQIPVAVAPGDNEASLHERIKVAERAMLVDVVSQMARGWTLSGRQVKFHD